MPVRCRLSSSPNTSVVAKQTAAKTRLKAFQYDLINPPEPSSTPLAVFKRWLYSKVPILRNEELISRTAWTLMVIAIVRFGQQLRLPYVDANIAPQSGTSSTSATSCFAHCLYLCRSCALLEHFGCESCLMHPAVSCISQCK